MSLRCLVAAFASTSILSVVGSTGFLGSIGFTIAGTGVAHGKSAAAPAPSVAIAEPPIAQSGPEGAYLTEMHRRIHPRWIETFVKTVASTHPATHPFNDLRREVTIRVSIRWDGTVADLKVQRPSGSPAFDGVGLDMLRKSAPYPFATGDVVSDDGYVHVAWTFARDQRACAARPRLLRVEDPLDIALPRLLAQHRVPEALRRVGDAAKSGHDDAVDGFARLYLRRPTGDPILDVAAAAALAAGGDRSQIEKLRSALGSAVTAPVAARALADAGVDVCPQLAGELAQGSPGARDAALAAVEGLGQSARDEKDFAACQPGLTATLSDRRQPRALRMRALALLARRAPGSSRDAMLALEHDPDLGVRGAAILASVRKGGGRAELYRLAPMLRHHAVEVRAAASAGVVRASGDAALDQLYRLWRETDARPAEAVARELAEMDTPASAEFLGRLAEKNVSAIKMAAVRALAARQDAAAKTLLAALCETAAQDPRAPAELRTMAARLASAGAPSGVDAGEAPQAGSGTQQEAHHSYRELLASGRRDEAAAWLTSRFAALPPREAVEVLDAWFRQGSRRAKEGVRKASDLPASGSKMKSGGPTSVTAATLQGDAL